MPEFIMWSSDFIPFALGAAVLVGCLLGALLALLGVVFHR